MTLSLETRRSYEDTIGRVAQTIRRETDRFQPLNDQDLQSLIDSMKDFLLEGKRVMKRDKLYSTCCRLVNESQISATDLKVFAAFCGYLLRVDVDPQGVRRIPVEEVGECALSEFPRKLALQTALTMTLLN